MSLTFIIFILLLGVVFLILEILVLPGITIPGIAGVILLVLGIYLVYHYHGNAVGHITLGAIIILGAILTIIAFRFDSWRKVSLKKSLNERVESHKGLNLKEGDVGETISRLAPIGNIKVHDKIIEAKSREGYINEGVKVSIIEINSNIVEVVPLQTVIINNG